MPKIALTDTVIRALPTPDRGQQEYFDTAFKGGVFALRVSRASKTFLIWHRNRRITLGRYPILTLADARTEGRRLLAEFTLRRLQPKAMKFTEARDLFLEEKRERRRPKTIEGYEYCLRYFPFTGFLDQVSYHDIQHALKKISSLTMRSHCLAVLCTFFTWAHAKRMITDNPCAGLSPQRFPSRERVLSDTELAKIWRACEPRQSLSNSDRSPQGVGFVALTASYALLIQILILTGLRRSECAAIQTSWITKNSSTISVPPFSQSSSQSDLPLPSPSQLTDPWVLTIPGSITKNKREICIPLGPLAISILKPAMELALSKCEKSIFRAMSERGACFSNWSGLKKRLDSASGITDPPHTLHDIRRSYRTGLAKLGVPSHVAERLVNHVSARNPMERIYDQHDYWDEMTAAVLKWEAHIKTILAST